MKRIDHHRTVWLSDVHLGSRACRAALLLDFLARTDCETLYLVGDIVDLQSLRRSFYWPPSHTEVVRQVLDKARRGTRIVYIPGNHDEDLRALAGMRIGPLEIERQWLHTTAAGKRLLVLHGDELDADIRHGTCAALLGCFAYRLLLALDRWTRHVDALLGKPYRSVAQTVKMRFASAVRYVARFQSACVEAARSAGADGIVCGHIHRADISEHDGLVYCNDGDWVESCTAVVESQAGELSLRRFGQAATAIEARPPIALGDAA